jgi:hypothetical protein
MQVTEVASEASGVSQLLLVMPTTVELLARKVAAANLAKQQATAAAQMEKSANPAMWAQEKMQQWKEQEAARTARAAQAVQEYKDTQQAQDELNSLEWAMQTMGVSFEITIENDTDLNKQKASGKQRLREENEGEDMGGEKRKPTSQEEAASGGGSTSVTMDE